MPTMNYPYTLHTRQHDINSTTTPPYPLPHYIIPTSITSQLDHLTTRFLGLHNNNITMYFRCAPLRLLSRSFGELPQHPHHHRGHLLDLPPARH